MAAYLAGSHGRPRDAFFLGGVVSLMHTFSVLVLGLVLVRVSRSLPADKVYPWLTLGSGIVVTVVGAWLLVGRARLHRHGHHRHGHHGHDHLDEGRRTADVSPISRKGLVALGTTGGLFPSPSALIMLLGAFTVGRAGLGLALIAAFSVGLAATLTAVGLLLVYGRRFVARFDHGAALRWLPLASAAAIGVLGVVLTVRGAAQV
jgi:ABC-type nickel/cobalt efflux system permease component RcnA